MVVLVVNRLLLYYYYFLHDFACNATKNEHSNVFKAIIKYI